MVSCRYHHVSFSFRWHSARSSTTSRYKPSSYVPQHLTHSNRQESFKIDRATPMSLPTTPVYEFHMPSTSSNVPLGSRISPIQSKLHLSNGRRRCTRLAIHRNIIITASSSCRVHEAQPSNPIAKDTRFDAQEKIWRSAGGPTLSAGGPSAGTSTSLNAAPEYSTRVSYRRVTSSREIQS